jgi:Tol biopolymer transport system component
MFWSKKTIWNLSTILMTVAILLVVRIGNARADFVFGEPVNLGPTVNSGATDWSPSISADGLELYFESDRSGGLGSEDLWVSTRATIEDDWAVPVNLGPTLNTAGRDWGPSISGNGLELYFSSNRAGGSGGQDLWVSRRATTGESWGAPVNLGSTVNSSSDDIYPCISSDGLELYFNCDRDWGLYVTRRSTTDEPWGAPAVIPGYMIWPGISANGRAILFGAEQSGGYGSNDIWVRTRATTEDDWGTAVNLGPTVNGPSWDCEPTLSHDGLTIYFTSDRGGGLGGWDTWQAPIIPIVDFNGDGIVDSTDMCIMIDHWGEDYSLCDIGPTPLGDGTVDVQDLIVLAEHLFEEAFPMELVAYWKLDEEEGDIAYNSISDNHGVLNGEPLWQPTDGMIGGALQLDGINDYVETDFVLNPTDGVFSAFAWIKGGAPGQVIISQADGIGTGETWLGITASDGNLMTGLMPYQVGRTVIFPLESQSLITDGLWHHVGFVWDGSYRFLYVDGTEVAKDTNPITLSPLIFANGGLYIGAGKALDAGTLFSGLIDDIRIYDVALSAEQIEALAQ